MIKSKGPDYTELKEEIKKMNKLIKRSDIEAIHKRQKLISRQKNKKPKVDRFQIPPDLESQQSVLQRNNSRLKMKSSNRSLAKSSVRQGTMSSMRSFREEDQETANDENQLNIKYLPNLKKTDDYVSELRKSPKNFNFQINKVNILS